MRRRFLISLAVIAAAATQAEARERPILFPRIHSRLHAARSAAEDTARRASDRVAATAPFESARESAGNAVRFVLPGIGAAGGCANGRCAK